jgi:hypothetical protein
MKEEVMPLGIWWALGALLAVVLALAYATSPGAEHPLDWTSQQLDKLFGN